MKPLIVLITTFFIALLTLKLCTDDLNYTLPGNIAMSCMLTFTAIGHFAYTKGMEMMMPNAIPFKTFMVYFTGVIELAAAAGILIASLQTVTAYLLIVFFILMLPCNIYAASKKVDYQKANYNGPGTSYLWFRIPFQAVLILWVYFCNLYTTQ